LFVAGTIKNPISTCPKGKKNKRGDRTANNTREKAKIPTGKYIEKRRRGWAVKGLQGS